MAPPDDACCDQIPRGGPPWEGVTPKRIPRIRLRSEREGRHAAVVPSWHCHVRPAHAAGIPAGRALDWRCPEPPAKAGRDSWRPLERPPVTGMSDLRLPGILHGLRSRNPLGDNSACLSRCCATRSQEPDFSTPAAGSPQLGGKAAGARASVSCRERRSCAGATGDPLA